MQIRLTVLAPRSGHAAGRACDVLVTAPAGTALSAVASALATAVSGPDVSGTVVLYAGTERLDAQRCALGEPPLIDGAVLSLQVPGQDETHGVAEMDAPAQLRVVAGPDAGGVHLLHGGQIRIGRSADADVPLDDPDVSRLHCAVTVADDGGVSVADLGSTNGTTLEGAEVGPVPVRLPAGALLRIGESAVRLLTSPLATPLPTTPDGEGHLRVVRPEGGAGDGAGDRADEGDRSRETGAYGSGGYGTDGSGLGPAGASPGPQYGQRPGSGAGGSVPAQAREGSPAGGPRTGSDRDPRYGASAPEEPRGRTVHSYGGPSRDPRVPDPRSAVDTHYGFSTSDPASGTGPRRPAAPASRADGDTGPGGAHSRAADEQPYATADDGTGDVGEGPQSHSRTTGTRRQGTPARGTQLPDAAARRRGGIGAWARRLAGGREEEPAGSAPGPRPPAGPAGRAPLADTWPDPAEVLMTALGPGPRLWERDSDHAEALVVRLGTADRPAPDGVGLLPGVPVTVALREAGSLGLAGPRERLTGLARSVVAQLAALHSPADLEIVLISTDRARSPEQRRQEWGWLGWLPQVRPAHGQDCRLLLAYDRDQATARTAELTRRLDAGPLGTGWASADPESVARAAGRHEGPYTVVVVDGDPGSASLRQVTARLASAGAAAGIHLVCLAETPAASPLSPVAATYETACAASLPFRECGAVGLLSGDVASALRLLRTAVGEPAGHGTVAVVDAVSPAWAERFGRALAPLRTAAGGGSGRAAAALPHSARLLDELGLARATPASLMARWASAADGTADCTAVLGAGPHGPVSVDLAEEGPHLLIEGPAGSGRSELLRSVAASLAAADRPDRLGLLLVDGAGGERGEGLGACTELPHVLELLVASDPVRMREFAQALGAELKRRAELLGRLDFTEWHSRHEVAERMVGPRPPSGAEQRTPPGGTLRLRTTSARTEPEPEQPPLPRLVVLVDDFDALVAPALGSPGRPAAGSVVRALEAVARDGERLGVHLVASSACPNRTSDTDLAQGARLRVVLDPPPAAPSPDDPSPGRGRLGHPDGRVTPFQGGRVTGRIPRTATLRPTVVPLEWERMGDPPTRRPVRELGNGPTDLALLASALERAARSVHAVPVAPLAPAHP
ncbi:FtsK/SpoIIIE domain-containing protein [Streptomyces liangshanensis]|uniref:FHA domain-containing protein n=1 Tax=Streptomyces liangshanensis TaxID=2717324 RepID=A0A6G9H2Q1_9ACTN|nr:FtsK/SpoIIIE domain-containing protein [Streptomyces liangshanensis]QIQ04569.1 FHA domain-containing protein [Streptomyces liangshanensis]